MKTIVTGTVGLDKGPFLDKVARIARGHGHEAGVFHVGRRMYAEAPDVTPGRILDLPISRLSTLRRSVFKDLLMLARDEQNLIVNTHATFRWRHGLFPAFDFDQLRLFDADLYVCLVDSVEAVHARLEKDHVIDHSLKDILVWREEEILATEMMMLGCRQSSSASAEQVSTPTGATSARFFVLAVGPDHDNAETLYRLMFRPTMPRAYLSFPMTHVVNMPTVLSEINHFRRAVAQRFVVFDPGDLEEQALYEAAVEASQRGRKSFEFHVLGRTLRFDVGEVLQSAGDIHGQIYARDFMLIDQANMIISFIPELADGKPGLSSGVERELQHAHEAAKDVFIIWRPRQSPSPFVTETATRIFKTLEEALEYFTKAGHLAGVGPQETPSTLFPVW